MRGPPLLCNAGIGRLRGKGSCVRLSLPVVFKADQRAVANEQSHEKEADNKKGKLRLTFIFF